MRPESTVSATPRRPPGPCRSPSSRPLALVLGFVLTAACNIDNPGDGPPAERLYFPNALTIAPAPEGGAAPYLYVANANFDLRFSGGTVQAIDLEAVDRLIEDCGDDPGCTLEPAEVIEDSIVISSFSTAMELSSEQDHLLVTTRTDSGLVFIDVDHAASGDDVLRCGNGARCGQVASEPSEEVRERGIYEWPGEPAAIASGSLAEWALTDAEAAELADREYVVVAHREGDATLFVEGASDADAAFEPAFSLHGLPREITGISRDPVGGLLHLSLSRNTRDGVSETKTLLRIGIAVERGGEPGAISLYDAGPVTLLGVAVSNDTRDLTFVDAISGSGVAQSEGRALVVAREPSALLVVDVDEGRNGPGRARVKRVTELGAGPSRMVVGELDGVPMAFISCFDMREIFVVDLINGLARSVIPNLSGPFELALDVERKRLYAADFRTSVIRVIDLAPITDDSGQGPTAARLVATIGRAQIVQELQ